MGFIDRLEGQAKKASSVAVHDPVPVEKTTKSQKDTEKDVAKSPVVQLEKADIKLPKKRKALQVLDSYNFTSNKIPISIRVFTVEDDFVPIYEVSISSISKTTEVILERIRKELINEVNLGIVEITDTKNTHVIENRFTETIVTLIEKYFPDIDEKTTGYLTTYLIQKSLGMGNIEILMDDDTLEEIAVNNSDEPVWVYHKKHGWLKTNIMIESEDQIKSYATMIGRKVGRQITVLDPLLDAHLSGGDRVNATLNPISTKGNTITLRKYSRDPMTITHFLEYKTLSPSAASLIWQSMQYELSAIIAGGTASGKTSMLNVLANFFPPNQRIISIEDTRELRLPKFLHWLPMSTRIANAEGRGGVSMENLLINSLRQRPDRIIVGEVRQSKQAETLFEAIHTGHSCYATFHANNAKETVKRLTNPPINVPKLMLPAISLIVIQYRNRRTGFRRTFQLSEITEDAEANILQQYNPTKDILEDVNKSKSLLATLQLYTGFSEKEIKDDLLQKQEVLAYLVKKQVKDVDSVGRVIAEYYTNKDNLFKYIKAGKILG